MNSNNIKKLINDINAIISIVEIECCFINSQEEIEEAYNDICKLNDFISLLLYKINKYNIN